MEDQKPQLSHDDMVFVFFKPGMARQRWLFGEVRACDATGLRLYVLAEYEFTLFIPWQSILMVIIHERGKDEEDDLDTLEKIAERWADGLTLKEMEAMKSED